MEMQTSLIIQITLCAVFFLCIFLLIRSNCEAEKELKSGENKK